MRKKLFAVIMSAMMMITFMPSMAFAAPSYVDGTPTASYTVKWYSDFSKAVFTDAAGNEEVVSATRTLHDDDVAGGIQWDGTIDVTATFNNETSNASYVDFTGSYLSSVYYDGSYQGLTAASVTYDKAEDCGLTDKTVKELSAHVTVVAPDYATKNVAVSYNGSAVADIYGVSFKIVRPNFDASKRFTANQDFTMPVLTLVDYYYADDNVLDFMVGTIADKTLTVKKDTADYGDLEYGFDGKVATAPFIYYDGAEHTFGQLPMTGFSTSFQMYKDNKWQAADPVKLKNVGTYYIKGTKSGLAETANYGQTALYVESAGDVEIVFKDDSFNVAGSFKPADFLTVKAIADDSTDAEQVKAIKAAAKADEKEIMAYFNEKYEIVNDGSVYTIVEKVLTPAEEAAIEQKYETLLDNYNWDIDAGLTYGQHTATFNVVDDIEFTKAPLTKTYKFKTLKKKSKTFSVKAKSSKGSSLYYKLTNGAGMIKINKSTGKVTVKKGIKKGTYKVGVYAYSLENGSNAYNNYTLKIKVK